MNRDDEAPDTEDLRPRAEEDATNTSSTGTSKTAAASTIDPEKSDKPSPARRDESESNDDAPDTSASELAVVHQAKVSIRELFHVAKLRRLRPFFIWLALLYPAWVILIAVGGHWSEVFGHWEIAVAMALGSYVAGSTPMGGGTIGFPVLVLLFDLDPTIGRDFSFLIQSVGMTSAAIFIFATRARRIAWRVMIFAMIGTSFGTPLGCVFVAPRADPTFIKLLFAVIWASFGLMHFYRINDITSFHNAVRVSRQIQMPVGLFFGFLGGIISSIVGVGIDMLVYIMLVVLFRADLKIAIPTSVILMAYTSVIGAIATYMNTGIDPEVWSNWYAAAPIVAVGAPFGALVVHFMPRKPTLLIVSGLCVFQYFWTLYDGRITGTPLYISVAGIIAFNIFFYLLYAWGGRLNRRVEQERLQRHPGLEESG